MQRNSVWPTTGARHLGWIHYGHWLELGNDIVFETTNALTQRELVRRQLEVSTPFTMGPHYPVSRGKVYAYGAATFCVVSCSTIEEAVPRQAREAPQPLDWDKPRPESHD